MIQRFLYITSSSFVFLLLFFAAPTHALADVEDFIAAMDAENKGDHAMAANLLKKYLGESSPEEAGSQIPTAELALGAMYRDGEGVRKNTKEAIRLFEKAANGSDNAASNNALFALGQIYQTGSDINGIDLVRAVHYYSHCAKRGTTACKKESELISKYPEVYVALHPEKFRLTKKEPPPVSWDYTASLINSGKFIDAFPMIVWWAKSGNDLAQLILSDYYKNTPPGVKDDDLYKGWLLKSAENGNLAAQHELGLFYYSSGHYIPNYGDKRAEEWLKKAAAKGYTDSINALGVIKLHPNSEGVKENPEDAVRYFEEAANAGSPTALINLGDMYYDGIGVIGDKEKAKKMYMQAADSGDTAAYLKLFEKYGIDYKKKSILDTTPPTKVADTIPPKTTDSTPAKIVDTAPAKVADATPPKTVDTTALKMADTAPPKVVSVAKSAVEIYLADSKSVMKLIAVQNENSDSYFQGSAVAITTSKAITNCHVVNKMGAIVALVNGKPQGFQISSSDVGRDICIITPSEKSEDLHPIPETRSYDDLKIGEKVYAIGSPKELDNTLSDGIISGLRNDNGKKLIQVTAPITHGSSGGALIDEHGKLIGITSGMLEGEGNLNFAIPVDVALNILLAKN